MTANTTAGLDANGGPQPAGTKINIHTNSDALDTTPDAPLNAGDFDQVGSAIRLDRDRGRRPGSRRLLQRRRQLARRQRQPAHDCFAGYTGFVG